MNLRIFNSRMMFALVLWGSAAVSLAQDKASHARGAGTQGQSRVWFQDATVEQRPNSTEINFQDLAQLTNSFFRLRLQEIPALKVITGKAPSCGGQSSPVPAIASRSVQARSEVQAGAESQNQIGLTGEESAGTFFVVRVSLDAHHPPDLYVDYSLEKCSGGASSVLLESLRDNLRVPIPTDRSSFAADKVIEGLNNAAQSLAYLLENPPTTVAVEDFQPKDEKLANALTAHLKRAVPLWSGFRVSEISDNPEYRVSGKVSGSSGDVEVSFVLWSNGKSQFEGKTMCTARKSFRPAEKKVTSEIFEALNDLRLAQSFGVNSLATMDFHDLLRKGEHLLCEDEHRNPLPACRQDVSAAIRVFQVASQKAPKAEGWNAAYHLGRAQAAQYKYQDAITSLAEALEKLETSPDKGKDEVSIHNALGDVYAKHGENDEAAQQYKRSLELDPTQADLYVKRAEAVFGNDHSAGILVLLGGLGRLPEEGKLHSALLETVGNLEGADFEPVGKLFQTALDNGVPIRDEFAMMWIREGESEADPAKAGEYADNALRLDPVGVQVRAEAYAVRVWLDLPGKLDEAEKYLKQAEALPQDKLPPRTLNWLLRLRATYLLDQKNYEAAYEQAKRAEDIDTASYSLSRVLSAQVAVTWADEIRKADPQSGKANELYRTGKEMAQEQLRDASLGARYYYIKANHALSLDHESRETLADLVKNDPQDVDAGNTLIYLCAEYAFDFDCSYSEARKLMPFFPKYPMVHANAAEAAVLNGEYQQAGEWLKSLLARPDLDAETKAVGDFYKLWIALARDQAEVKSDFDSVLQSLSAYVKAPSESLSLQGARRALPKTGLTQPKQDLLGEIISVLEDPSKGTASIKLPQEI